MSRAAARSHPPDAHQPARAGRGRRGFLTASALAFGAGVAATACQDSSAAPGPPDGNPGDVLVRLSAGADAKANGAALDVALVEAAAKGARVVLPGGEFGFLGMTIPATGRMTIVGAGRGITVLRNEGPAPSVTVHGAPGGSEYASDWSISGLSLTADERRSDQAAISVQLASRFSVRDVMIRGFGIGVRHESSWDGGYDGVTVFESGIGWQFAATNFAPSAPLGLRNCSALNCDTAASFEDDVDALEWVGGDFSGCGTGMLILGDETRSISLHGINFERIRGNDLVVGDDRTGPASVTVSGCRFLRVDRGGVSVRFVRGDALTFNNCRWTTYGTAVEQGEGTGLLALNASTGYEVDRFITNGGQVQPQGVLNATAGTASILLSLDQASVLPAVVGVEGVATKVISGPGRVSATDADFAIPPRIGSTAVLRNETDGSLRHAIRGETGWFVSAPYESPNDQR